MVILLINTTRSSNIFKYSIAFEYSVHNHGNFLAGRWKIRWNAFYGQSEASKLGKSARVLHSFSYKLRHEDFARQHTV